MKLTEGQMWLILWAVVAIVVGTLMTLGIHSAQSNSHRENIECLNQGGSYEPVNDDYAKLICKK